MNQNCKHALVPEVRVVNPSDERTAAAFTNLLSELEMIQTCYEKAADACMIQLRKAKASKTFKTECDARFSDIERLMEAQVKQLKNAGLTIPLNDKNL